MVGERCWLDAVGGVAAGVQLQEFLDAFAHSEWLADWDQGAVTHGEAMTPALLARSDAQRRFDALLAVFHAAAASTASHAEPAVTVNLVVGYDTFTHHLTKTLGGDPSPLPPGDPQARCETTSGVQVDPFDMLVAAAIGHVRRVVIDSHGVIVDVGRRQRLFTGPLREAVLLSQRECFWPGCNRPAGHCQADHVLPYGTAGPTRTANGAPACAHHNRWRSRGYRTRRDPHGHWHHYRPDGTELGWRATVGGPSLPGSGVDPTGAVGM